MQSYLQENKADALAVCVMQNGKVLYRSFFGSVYADKKQQPDGNTLFRLASMTKPVTAAAVLREVEQGRLMLDRDISFYLPCFKKMHIAGAENGSTAVSCPAKNPITVRHLLSHTSGVGSGQLGAAQFDAMPAEASRSLKKATEHYATLPLLFEPGTKQEYSPVFAFDILAGLTQEVSGQPFNEYVREHICKPLGMVNTVFEPDDEQMHRLAYLHTRTQDGKNADASPLDGCLFAGIPNSRFCGGAGLAGSLDDYVAFAQMLLQNGAYNGKSILSARSVQQMQQPQVSEKCMPGSQQWGLGVRVITKKSYSYLPVGTFGWSGAYGTHFWVDPKNAITAVLMRNSLFDGGAGSRLGAKLEKAVYGVF